MKKCITWFLVAGMLFTLLFCCAGCQKPKKQIVATDPTEPAPVVKNLLPSKIISSYEGNSKETEITYTENSISFTRGIWAMQEGEEPTFIPSWVITPDEAAQQVAIGILKEDGAVEYGYTYIYEGGTVTELDWTNEVHFRMDYALEDSKVQITDTEYTPEQDSYSDDTFTMHLSSADKTLWMDLDWGSFEGKTLTYENGILSFDGFTCAFDDAGRPESVTVEGRTVTFVYDDGVENTYYQGQMIMPMLLMLTTYARPEYMLATQIAYQQFEQ